ncbi:MAG: hypothetical protein HGA62_04715 [Chlorobiaceae bacterium]|nr:hypothetical protein [Chlorobiaceae bacterium]NTV61641.1 hypothetical protein [Chlorobiaceae bacterium]
MEQEVPVIIHGEHEPLPGKPGEEPVIADQLKEIGHSLSEVMTSFRESESYEQIEQVFEQTKDYIRKNPARAMLYSLGAGALLGLFMRKRR